MDASSFSGLPCKQKTRGLETGLGWVHIVSNPDLPFLFGMGSGFETRVYTH